MMVRFQPIGAYANISAREQMSDDQGLDVRELDMEAIRKREAEMRDAKLQIRRAVAQDLANAVPAAKDALLDGGRFNRHIQDNIELLFAALDQAVKTPEELVLEAAQEELLRMLDIVREGLRRGA